MSSVKYKEIFRRYAIITFGIILTSYSLSVLLIPNKIVSGGLSGVSAILFYLTGIDTGWSMLVFNFVLMVIALIFIGKEFVAKTIYGAVTLSLFIQLFSYLPPVTDNMLLATVFGAIISGIGLGVVFSQDASTAGTDILGRLFQLIFKNVKIGSMLIILDGMIIIISYAVLDDIDAALYGVVSVVLGGLSIDFVLHRLNAARLALIITGDGLTVSDALMKTLERGVTRINAVGAYTNNDKHILVCALKDKEMPELQRQIKEIDENAFIIMTEAQGVEGNGFKLYK